MSNKNQAGRPAAPFGNASARYLPPYPKNKALTDRRTPEQKIASGMNPFEAWRTQRYISPEAAAKTMGVTLTVYKAFEKGEYRGITEEGITRFSTLCYMHPGGLVQPGVPMCDALLTMLVGQVQFPGTAPEKKAFSVRALRTEVNAAYTALQQQRGAHNPKTAANGMIVSMLGLLEGSFTLGRAAHADPDDITDMFMDEVREKRRGIDARTQKPKFLNDDIWRTYSDAALRLYGPKAGITKAIEDLRKPFRQYAWEWDVVTNMVADDPEVLHPMVWHDDMGSQFVGGRLMNRDQTVRAMMGSYKAYQQRDVAVAAAKTELAAFDAQMKALDTWLRAAPTVAFFKLWRNRQTAQEALGVANNALMPAAPALPAPARFSKS